MFKRFYQKSFSQCGEDCIVNFLRNVLKIDPFSYLDIGAHHPFRMNNTASFYKMGYSGVLVEPDPTFYRLLKKSRKRDIVLNCGITPTHTNEKLTFFLIDPPSLNTFSREDAERYESMGHKIIKTIDIPCLTVTELIERYFPSQPTFVSIDCEGLDVQILKSINFMKNRPGIISVETLEYRNDMKGEKNLEIPNIMDKAGYFAFSDTFINTIFLDRAKWKPV